MLFQIFFSLFTILAISQTLKTGRGVGMSIRGRVVWVFMWGVSLLIVWEPSTADFLANGLGIGRGADVIVYIAISTLFFLLFKLHVKLSVLESQITSIVRDRALDESK